MARVLLVWETGDNLGHLANLRPFMEVARQQGHELSVALRTLRFADQVLGDIPCRVFQAPHRQARLVRNAQQSLSYTHQIEDFCFASAGELGFYLAAWDEIFAAFRPDLVVYDSSPVALIASHGRDFAKIVTGTGFSTPPAELVDGVFAPFVSTRRDGHNLGKLRDDDASLLATVNSACQTRGLPVFDHVAGIFAQVDRELRLTLRELDHFGPREPSSYLGVQPSFSAVAPVWPDADGPRVFCYLQNFPFLSNLLQALAALDANIVLYGRDLPEPIRRLVGPKFTLAPAPVSLEAVSREAGLVVSHGSHLTAAQCYRLGVPQLCVPVQQEQVLLALHLNRTGTSLAAMGNQGRYERELSALLRDSSFRENAAKAKSRYAAFDWSASQRVIGQAMTELLN